MLVDEKYYHKKVLLLNFILSCLIVIIHSVVPERYGVPIDDYPFVNIVVVLCKIATPTFFFLSAILFYRNCRFLDLERKFTRRVHSLLIPFLLWNTFFVLLYYILTHLPFVSGIMRTTTLPSTLKELLLAIWNSEYTDLWFIRNLMVYIVLAPIFLLILKNKLIATMSFVILLVYVLTSNVGHYELITWVPIYLMGAMWGYYGWSNIRISFRYDKWVVPIIFLVIYLLVFNGCINLKIMRNTAPILIWMMVDVFLYDFIDKQFEIKDWLGYTFFIYATHHFVLNVMQKVVVIFLPPTQLVVNITFILTPLMTIILLVYICRTIKNTTIYKVMCGRR